MQEAEINEKNELVAQLKDQRQETRVRTQLERSYVEHESIMQLQIARKQREMDRVVCAGASAVPPPTRKASLTRPLLPLCFDLDAGNRNCRPTGPN